VEGLDVEALAGERGGEGGMCVQHRAGRREGGVDVMVELPFRRGRARAGVAAVGLHHHHVLGAAALGGDPARADQHAPARQALAGVARGADVEPRRAHRAQGVEQARARVVLAAPAGLLVDAAGRAGAHRACSG
jgi:hypothetical protein